MPQFKPKRMSGQIKQAGKPPLNVELFDRGELTDDERAAGVTDINSEYDPGDVRRYGATGDGATNDTVAIQAAIDVAETNNGSVFGHAEDTYNFGTVAGDTVKITVTADIHMDWRGAKLFCAGTDGSFTSSILFQFLDCVADIQDYTFEDSLFAVASSTSRGVQPVNIRNTTANTQGHRIGPCHIIAGQSFVTASTTDLTKRASDIKLVGPCTGVDMYYGVNLANNGDRFEGKYFVNAYNRLWFVYGVDDVVIDCHGGTAPSASSGAGYTWLTTRNTTNITVRAVFEELNGLIRINDESTTGGLIFRNIDYDLHIKSYGSNLPSSSNQIVAIGTVTASSWDATSTVTMDNIKINFKSDTIPDDPIEIRTSSPNYGTLEVLTANLINTNLKGFLLKTDAGYKKGINNITLEDTITGATQANPVVVTAAAHGLENGDDVGIIGISGMTEINDRVFTVANKADDTFELSGEDGTGHTAYSSGGTVHYAVGIDVDDITYNVASSNWSFAVDSIARFNTAFSGQKTAVEHWSLHGYTASNGNISITAQNKAYLSQSGGDSPVGQFIAADSGSKLYGIMTGYATLVGALQLNYRHLG